MVIARRLSPLVLVLAACTSPAPELGRQGQGLSAGIVISQVYGGGGNSMAPFNQDFVELRNRGSTPLSIGGWAIQYGSATNNFSGNLHAIGTATIPAGGYFLIGLSTGNTGAALPTPDEVDTINLAATNGKVALLSNSTPLSGCGTTGSPCTNPAIVDLVGFGTGSQFETAAAAGGSNTTAVIRNAAGCAETDNNSVDFAVGAPTPRNSHSASSGTCNSTPVDAGPVDSSTTSDAGPAADVGPGVDVGTSTRADAGFTVDAGTSTAADAGFVVDAGSAADGGFIFDAGPYEVVLNEIKVNPPGTDNGFEYIELRGTGTLPAFTYVMSIEGDDNSIQGRVNYVRELSGVSFGANGIIIVRAPGAYAPPAGATVVDDPRLSGGVLQNGSESIVLVTSATRIDTAAGGADGGAGLFPFPGAAVIDAVGWRTPLDGGVQGTVFGGVDLTLNNGVADGVTRFLDDTTARSAPAWFSGRLTAGAPENLAWDFAAARSSNFPSDSLNMTPGAPNEGTRAAPALDAGYRDATVRDTGMAMDDAGLIDAGTVDSGLVIADASQTVDSGAVVSDAGQTADSGTRTDAGAGRADSGAGMPAADAGCGCSTEGGSSSVGSVLVGLGMIGFVVGRRRRA